MADSQDVHVGHIRVKGPNVDIFLDPPKSLTPENPDFNKRAVAFALTAKLPMRANVLVPRNDERDNT